ncbi:gamma-glutamyltransferase [Effusibacillus dendaii]|uniref:Glutathione hydrolase proenzyme n=1 Tax=Effusibacillus dendaii TaxID=2743772 RepID=A0A7I8DE80_9BACL|nr:gamma-glutamyltransferase [Effusibacillus dendaii]BCJ87146.1 putative gamma-glutamyltransferase YwrD [Effusibacillus dendaii]
MHKSVIGTKQMVVSPHYLASMAGNRMLEKGGNAFDAAVAVSACLAVVYPHMTGMGGDSFWLTYSQKEGKVRAYNGSGRSGSQVTREQYAGEASIPIRGTRSAITVPGMIDSWDAILKEYGRLSMRDVLQPAIEYAYTGFPFTKDQYDNTKKNFSTLSSIPFTCDIYTPGGQIPNVGERFIQRDLGNSLTILAEQGRDVFYKGELAQAIVSYLQDNGGLLTLEDFASHRGEWVSPISTTYRDYMVYQVPPNSQGFAGLMTLNILENFNFSQIEQGSFEYYHILVEALKRTFQDRNQYLTDPDFSTIPLDHLLSKEYAVEMAQCIRPDSNLVSTAAMGSDTAYAAVVDGEGNAVSFIQSLYFEFGSGVVAGNTGILLQNRGSFFSLNPSHVNTLEPRKRTFHTLMPAMACKNGKPSILYGTQGGEGQPQTQTAIITRMIEYGIDPQEAISLPRWVWGRTWGEDSQTLKIESRVSEETVELLKLAGHQVEVVQSFDPVMGHAQAIRIDEHGFLKGGADPRGDGAAVGY